MALIEEMESTGNWLFRWRSFMPLLLIALLFLGMKHYHYIYNSEAYDHLWEVFCLLISLSGLGIRAWTIGCAPARTSGRNTKAQVADKVNTSGIYSLVRHPLYLGNYFMILGVMMFTHFFWAILVFTLLYIVYYERIMFAEEAFLRRKFGDEYLDWAKVTPAVIPRFKGYKPSELKFSLRNVLRREYNGFFAVILSMFILELYGDWIYLHRLELDLHWLILMLVGLTSWISLRTIKKTTNWLKVEGR